MTTLLVTPDELAAGEVVVEGDAYRHLFRARRLAVGDPLRVVDGRGQARFAVVAAVDRRRGAVTLGDEVPGNDPPHRVELLVGSPKKERASWLVEKASELGVTAVRFLETERSPRDYGPGTFERFDRMARSALEQCGGARLPEITGIHAWSEVPDLLAGTTDRFVLHVDPGDTASPLAWSDPSAASRGDSRAALLVGPEGDWTDEEAAELLDLGCRAVHLGVRVLRVETAAVVAAAGLLANLVDSPPAAG